jgi:Zn-dependent protease/CBS domain-containing protein
MTGRSFHLFSMLGFPIRVDPSWFVVVVLVTWSLATGYFPTVSAGLGPGVYWTMGAAGALGLFGSIVLHELGHAVVARRFDLPIREIVLFIFGGVARMEREPPTPRAEFFTAIGGPIVSVLLAGGFFVAFLLARGVAVGPEIAAVLGYLALINAIVVAFNLVPAFPLDGGRVLRSILWGAKQDLRAATRITSTIGAGFGLLMIGLGVVTVVSGEFLAGLWWGLLGLFLYNAARMSYTQLLVRRSLEGEPLDRFVNDRPVTVAPDTTIREVVEDFVYRHHFKMFPVVDGDRLVGCVTTRRIREIPRERWETTTAGEVLDPCGSANTISPRADAIEALATMNRYGTSRLMVVDGERLLGIVALKDLLQFLSLKVELEGKDAIRG